MKAIVLTYDANHVLAHHMAERYDRVWPDHPFRFRIPYQSDLAKINGHEYVRSPEGIRATVLKLIEDIPDEEWIYWCMDDKYPIALKLARIQAILSWLRIIEDPAISGILFCRCRELYRRPYLTGASIQDPYGNTYVEHKGYEQIWIHQFVKVKVIRHLFQNFPDDIHPARTMERFKRSVTRPESHRLFVTKENLAVFGESTAAGELTQNCYESLAETNLSMPDRFPRSNGKTTIMGKLGSRKV